MKAYRSKCATRGCKSKVHEVRVGGKIYPCALCRPCCNKGMRRPR